MALVLIDCCNSMRSQSCQAMCRQFGGQHGAPVIAALACLRSRLTFEVIPDTAPAP